MIGIDSAGGSSSNGFGTSQSTQGFAVPINTAMAIVNQIQTHTASATVHIGATAFLGVGLESASDQSGFGFGDGSGSSTSGALIASVVSGAPAAQAGLAAGDTIVSVDGHAVDSPTTLSTLMGSLPSRRQGVDRLDRHVGRAAHEHRDARQRTGRLRSGDPAASRPQTRHTGAPVAHAAGAPSREAHRRAAGPPRVPRYSSPSQYAARSKRPTTPRLRKAILRERGYQVTSSESRLP